MTARNWHTATNDELMDADLALELGLTQMTPAAMRDFLKTCAERVHDSALRRAIATLDPRKRLEIEALTVRDDGQGIKDFLEREVPNFAQLVYQETIRFKRVMLTESPEEAAALAVGQRILDQSKHR